MPKVRKGHDADRAPLSEMRRDRMLEVALTPPAWDYRYEMSDLRIQRP